MKRKNLLLYFGVMSGIAALIVFPAQTQEAVREGLKICGTSVIPSLFPFFVLTKFLISCRSPGTIPRKIEQWAQACFGVGGNCMIALCISFLGGYPTGVSTVVSLYEAGSISKREAETALRFCNNSGPAFFVGVIGGAVLGSVRFGLLLFLVHILASLICGFFFAPQDVAAATLRRIPQKSVSFAQGFLDAVSASCAALLQISGLVLFFSVILAFFESVGLISLLSGFPLGVSAQELRALLCGVLELSSGIVRLRGTEHAAQFAAFLMGWGGLCVHLQAISLWQPAGLRPKRYFSAKLLQGLFSVLLLQAFLTPSPFILVLVCLIFGICIFFPRFRKNGGRNPHGHAL